jgi:hypothetical protein
MSENIKTKFEELLKLNVNDKIEEKNKFKYLSWSFAVEEMTKAFPNWTYNIKEFNGLPYWFDEKTGYMVSTEITAGEVKKMMWLPVMDFRNQTLMSAKMTDINKSIMRCLVKNIAMFGIGLYIYSGEDLPEGEEKETKKPISIKQPEPKKEPSKISDFEKAKSTLLEITDLKRLEDAKNKIQNSSVYKEENKKELLSIVVNKINELSKE